MAKSSKEWLRRHVTDPYVRKAREQGYRSRAAYKLPGVTVLKGDFRDAKLLEALEGRRADVILSDVLPNLSGIANVDQARAAELTYAALELCQKALKPNGIFVVKAFQGEAFNEVLQRLKHEFVKVAVRKPEASRGESRETYVVASAFRAKHA